MGAADRAQLIAELLLDDKFTKPLNRIDKRLGAFSGAVNRNVGRGIDSAVSAVARGVVRVGKSVATAAIDWEDAFQGVIKTVDATPKQFDEISASLRSMSTEMPNTALELANIAAAGGAMGIKAKDIEAFTKQVAILASTTNVSADDAATALGQLQNVIGLTGDEFDNFTAALVDLGNKGSSTESQILEIERRAGGAAKLIGVAKKATLGWSAAAANLGLNEELAGTALQNFFVKSQVLVSNGGKKLNAFAKVAGMTAKDFAKAFRKDASGALTKFVGGLGDLTKGQRIQAIQKFFGKGSGMTRLVLGLADSMDKNLNPSLRESAKAWDEATAAQAEFDKRNATVKSAFARLKNTAFDAAVTVGEGFAPALGRAADKLSAFLKIPANRSALKSIGEDIGRIIDKVDWDGLLSDARSFMGALEKTAGFASALWDAFSAIPSDAKAVLLSLAGLNKLSGGAVTDVFKGLGKGLFDQFLQRGGSPANPLWVQSVGGGVGGGAPGLPVAAGAAAGGGGIAGLAGAALPALTAVAVGAAMKEGFKQLSSSLFPPDLATAMQEALRVTNPLVGVAQTIEDIPKALGGIAEAIKGINKPTNKPSTFVNPFGPNPVNQGGQMAGWAAGAKPWSDTGKRITDLQHGAVSAIDASKEGVVSATDQAKREVAARVASGAVQTANAATGAGSRIAAQGIADTSRVVGALYATRQNTLVKVDIHMSAGDVIEKTTTSTRYGGTSSNTDDGYNDHGK